jgi:hypothetical protein
MHGNELIVVICATLGFSKFKIASIDSLCMIKFLKQNIKKNQQESCII